MSLNQMVLCSKLKNGLCKIVTQSQVVTKLNVTKSRLHCNLFVATANKRQPLQKKKNQTSMSCSSNTQKDKQNYLQCPTTEGPCLTQILGLGKNRITQNLSQWGTPCIDIFSSFFLQHRGSFQKPWEVEFEPARFSFSANLQGQFFLDHFSPSFLCQKQ